MTYIDPHFHAGELEAQKEWKTEHIWNNERRDRLLWDHIPEELIERIETAPFFFLATSNAQGECDCSFKGGGPGLIKMLDSRHFAFPDMDGNGAFMSIGNIMQNPHVGCLFIDFSSGERLRVNGTATVFHEGDVKKIFPTHPRVILVEIDQVVPNCSAHIPKLVPAGEV